MARKKVTRREFVAETGTAAAAAAFSAKGFPMIVKRHVLGGPGYQAPSDTVNFAVAGFGGMGSGNAQELAKTDTLCFPVKGRRSWGSRITCSPSRK